MLAVLARRRAKLLARSTSQLATSEPTSQLARQRLNASKVKERLGKDLKAKVNTDVQAIRTDALRHPEGSAQRAIAEAEVQRYKESMQRLANSTYALQFEPNQEKMIERQNYFRENFEHAPNYKAQRVLGVLSADQVIQLPVELQRAYQYDVLSFYKQLNDEGEELMLNYNNKIPTSVKVKVYFENRKAGPKRAEFKKGRFPQHKAMEEKYLHYVRPPGEPEVANSIILREPVEVKNKQDLWLDDSERRDPTLPNVHVEDLRDDISGKSWTPKLQNKRIRNSTIIVLVLSSTLYMCYVDYQRQQESGGFQGVFLHKKIL